ncbi:carotenoid oxygenase family protein [Mesorhizobium sp. B2-3-5]|uniref:carotenoid oxygenase family protein n=1 Tax=Mesorhizobium sp. B2-3-5 TaxID=2589958 RepID=UPI001127CDB3|nr:carotenoid oxygenase family protein [Mesorhizobium sp. B2-3-5]TPM16336.1 carotenoid oxygenase family protein [Mesorhizobium sp. B2-3-5]
MSDQHGIPETEHGETPNVTLNRRDLLALTSAFAISAAASDLFTDAAHAADASDLPVYLQGQYKPTFAEVTQTDLRVRGAIPPALSGRYFRNGHNPHTPDIIPPFWFAGSGMIHGVRLKDGKAEWYRNRWVKTPALTGAPLFRADGSFDLAASAAATSVFAHAGKILALQEVNLPYQLTPDLDTVGIYDFAGKLRNVMTAHPKIDPVTGEMLFLSSLPVPPFLTYHVVDKSGVLVHSEVIDGAGPSLKHDFAITENYVLWFDASATFNPKSGLAFPYTFDTAYPARIGVMPRDRSKGSTRWISAPSYLMLHLGNAWEQDGKIVIEGPRYDGAAWAHTLAFINSSPGHDVWPADGIRHARWTIDPVKGTAALDVRDDLSVDFPTFNMARRGRASRYAYAVAFPGNGLKNPAIVKYDARSGERQVLEFKPGQMPNEAWFVADPNGTAEDDGWLMSYVGDLTTGKGELWIIDAKNMAAKPTAIVEIPVWVPGGIHGSWISDAELKA